MKSFIYTLLIGVLSLNAIYAQDPDIHFTFANAQITNDGTDAYYEADIMVASTVVDYYIGSGQLYIDYNTAAFGENIAMTSGLDYGQPAGSILGQIFNVFGNDEAGYKDFVERNNTSSRISLSFQQGTSHFIFAGLAGIITTNTPEVLMHIKLKYVDVNADPGICFFYDDGIFQDQFYTTEGILITDDTYDCTGAALSTGTDYVYNNGWSPSDPSGVSTSTSSIEIVAGEASISSNTIADNVVVRSGAGLSVNTDVTLETISGLRIESSSTSYGSLISDGTLVGSVVYDRHVNQGASSGGNDLITPPVSGQRFIDFLGQNSNVVSNGDNSLYLFGPFDKTSGSYLTYANTETATLNAGLGYRAATTDNGTLRFTGTVTQGDVNQAVFNSGPAYSEWNLIGNPYPSYLNVQDFLNNATNMSVLDANTVGIYGYDGDASDGWVIYNLNTTDSDTTITPGQGFFVAVASDASIAFTPDMRRYGTADDFIAGRETSINHHLQLELTSNSQTHKADFYFNANSTNGLDIGYDAAVFGNTSGDFAIYSQLLEGNTTNDFAIQSLPEDALSNSIIPLGVNATAGEQLTVNITASNLPDTIEVYIEDRQTNTFVLLNGGAYTWTPATDLDGTGRFYVHFSNSVLSNPEVEQNTLEIYTLQAEHQIVIKGQIQIASNAVLYDINGRKVVSTTLNAQGNYNTIDVTALQSGVYILQVSNKTYTQTKKVVIH
jgi:hypothetical protein